MKRAPLYSRSRRPARAADRAVEAPAPASTAEAADGTRLAPQRHAVIVRLGGPFWAVCGALAVGAALLIQQAGFSPARQLSQADIDAAVRSSIEKQPLPSAYATAYAAIRPSVVKVIGSDSDSEEATGSAQRDSPEAVQRSTGTGVVIVENGTILTNLHVVSGSKRLRVVFADGLESEAVVVSTQPENDLAVHHAGRIPGNGATFRLWKWAEARRIGGRNGGHGVLGSVTKPIFFTPATWAAAMACATRS